MPFPAWRFRPKFHTFAGQASTAESINLIAHTLSGKPASPHHCQCGTPILCIDLASSRCRLKPHERKFNGVSSVPLCLCDAAMPVTPSWIARNTLPSVPPCVCATAFTCLIEVESHPSFKGALLAACNRGLFSTLSQLASKWVTKARGAYDLILSACSLLGRFRPISRHELHHSAMLD